MGDIADRYRDEARHLAAASQDRWDCERILREAADGVTRSRVLRLTRRPATEVDRLLGTMLADGAIEIEVRYGRGRPLTVFKAKGKKAKKGAVSGEVTPALISTQGK